MPVPPPPPPPLLDGSQMIHEMKLKTVGVCFGHQCFAHAFGRHNEDDSGQDTFRKNST